MLVAEELLKQTAFMMNSIIRLIAVCCIISSVACNNEKATYSKSKDTTEVDLSSISQVQIAISTDSVDMQKAEKIEKLVKKLEKYRQFNGVLLVAEKGKVIYTGEVGNATFNPDKAADVHTPFHLASVSKQFTAAGIMILAKEGKLQIDDSVSKYIPELPYKGITIRHLLNHTSGVPRFTNYIPNYLKYWDSCQFAGVEDVPYILKEHAPPKEYNPGRRFSYNNTGYILLAVIIQRVSGMNYAAFIKEKIFKPVGMNESFVYNIHDLTDSKERAMGYSVYRRSYVSDEDDIRNGLLGEKGIYASAIDLYKWDQALYSDALFPDTLLSEAFSRGTLQNGRKINYGFGWRLLPKEDSLVYHFGHWRGFRAAIVRVLDDEVTVIALNNTGTRRLRYLVSNVLDIVYEDKEEKPKF